MGKQLTFLIIIHSEFNSIKYFDLVFSLFGNEETYDVFFVIDNSKEKISSDMLKILEKYNHTINKTNIGKINSIIENSNQIKTPFFKIVDQDDSLFLGEINDINDKLEKINKRSLVKHKAICIKSQKKKFYKRFESFEEIKEQTKHGKDVKWSQQTNIDTIYPTEVVREMKNETLTRQTYHNDILLSNFCVGTGSSVERINNIIYIHLYRYGQTRNYSTERLNSILELYENYLRINKANKEFNFNRLMNNSYLFHIIYILRFTRFYSNKNDKLVARKIYYKTKEILIELRRGDERKL